MKAIAYIRYSSDGQSEGDSIERQTENIQRYAAHNGLDIVETVTDEGRSASKGEHLDHELGRILDRAIKGEFKGFALLVERQDRLSRLDIARTNVLIGQLLGAGMIIHVTEENRVIRDQNDLMTVILNAVRANSDAEYSKKLSERIGSAWSKKHTAAIAGGKYLTKNVPAWLEIRDGKIVEVTEARARAKGITQKVPVAVVREMFRMASLGVGCKNICRELGDQVCSRVWVSNALRSRAVLGEFTCGETVIPEYFPRIIDQSLFNEVQRQMDLKQRSPGGNYRKSTTADNLFKGLLHDVTGNRDCPLYFSNSPDGKYKYLISKFDKRLEQNRINYRTVETAVLNFLTKEDWSAVIGDGECEPERVARAQLEIVLRDIDKISRQIAAHNLEMDVEGLGLGALGVLADRVSNFKTAMIPLEEKKTELQANVDAARAKCAALYESEKILALIKEHTPAANAIRMRLRSEIQKRVSRIDLMFNENPSFDEEGEPYGKGNPNVWVFVQYVNGVCHFAEIEEDGTIQAIRDGGKGVRATLDAVKALIARKRAAAGLS